MSPTPAVALDVVPICEDNDGVRRVCGTRVTLDAVVGAFDDGATPEEIVQQYPSLDLADVYALVTHVLRHRPEVDSYLERQRARSASVRTMNEARFDPGGLRKRLLARRSKA